MVTKVCIALDDECLAQMDYLRDFLRLNPSIKRSQLIRQIIFELYVRCQSRDDVDGFLRCQSRDDVDGFLSV